ncbi:MAG: helix-turn-helix domain-containing protein [Solirubrobacteraceae bacterium]
MEGKPRRDVPAVEPAFFRVGIDRATMRGRWLGARLRQHREAAGLKGAQVADRITRSTATLSRWESGDLLPRPAEVHYMLELYGVRGPERDVLVHHAEEAQRSGVLEVDMSVAVADHVWLEDRAWKVETFHNAAVPGLLQTADYAREILMAWDPAATAERIESAIGARAARQRRLTGEQPLQLVAILDEAVLRRPIGGRHMMRAQLANLVERAALTNVAIRVLPFAAGAHASLSGPFEIMQFRDEQDLVYLETRGGYMYLDRTEPFADAWRRLEGAALSEKQSAAMIAAVEKETS